MTEMAEDGRWHMSLHGQARGFHLRYVKVQNFEVLRPPEEDAPGRRDGATMAAMGSTRGCGDRLGDAERMGPLGAKPPSHQFMGVNLWVPNPDTDDFAFAFALPGSKTPATMSNADEDIPKVFMIYMPDVGSVPAIEHNGIARFFRNAHNMLCEFDEAKDPSTDVVFDDDPDGSLFVEIHTAWKAAGGSAAPCCIAKCKAAGLWGIGMASSQKCRLKAAKLSLAVALGMMNENLHEIAAKQFYPEIREMLAVAGFKKQVETS